MGGRGTYALGKNVAYTYKIVGKIGNIKILQPIDAKKSLKLPEESHSSGAYVLLNKDGVFHQYREYNTEHKVVIEIGYHNERALGKGNVLHIHIHQRPGVENHGASDTEKRLLTKTEYKKYKYLFKGVKINEREYFS
ncbi:MAG: hypothetical protein ACI3T2_08015 [Anaerovibrio sp.]